MIEELYTSSWKHW